MAEQQEDHVNLTIDGRPVSVPKGTLVWAAAQKLGIEVPIYCYHPKMDPVGACRMCFVEIEKMPKLATACTTVVSEGMVVRTDTPKVKKGRAGTLEFLLINHPLDCPICDKGGECDLQDFTLRHGPGASRFDLSKRHFPKPIPVSEHILLDRERCIACQRCVRFCQDVAMENGLVMKARGFRTEVGVEAEAPFDSIFSGNVVEMCPVGALTARSYRFVTRPWELRRTASVCGNCSVGCNVRMDVRVNRVLRQYSRTNDAIDDGWLCDRGRWGLDAFNSDERLTTPLVRRDGKLAPATWDEALRMVAAGLRDILRAQGPRAIGGIGSTHTTNEEAYLFQKLLRSLGTNNLDHFHGHFPSAEKLTTEDPEAGRGQRRADTSSRVAASPISSSPPSSSSVSSAVHSPSLPWVWTDSVAGLEEASHIVLLGADPYHRQPIVDLRIRKAIRAGARVFVVTPEPNRLDRLAAGAIRYEAGRTAAVVRTLLDIVLAEKLTRGAYAERYSAGSLVAVSPLPTEVRIGADLESLRALAHEIAGARGAVLLYDEMTTREPGGETLPADALALALLTDNFGRPGAGVGPLFEDNNSLGARDMGLLPDTLPGYCLVSDADARAVLAHAWHADVPTQPGLTYDEMLSGGVRALYVMGADPARHATPEQLARLEALPFLVAQDLFLTETAKRAQVVLPALSYAEKEGTFTNTERCIQVARRAMVPLPNVRADWEILDELARLLGLGWRYESPAAILQEIAHTVPIYAGVSRRKLGTSGARWPLIPGAPDAEGHPSVTGSPTLSWEMVERGIASGVRAVEASGGHQSAGGGE